MYNQMRDCNCGQLHDATGVEALKTLNQRTGVGGLTLIEKIINNPVALVTGFVTGGLVTGVIIPKIRRGRR
jgi:hypothetical protein